MNKDCSRLEGACVYRSDFAFNTSRSRVPTPVTAQFPTVATATGVDATYRILTNKNQETLKDNTKQEAYFLL